MTLEPMTPAPGKVIAVSAVKIDPNSRDSSKFQKSLDLSDTINRNFQFESFLSPKELFSSTV